MKKAFLYLFIGLSLVVWLVEMFTGWFERSLKNEKSVSLSFYWTITSGMVGRNVYRLV